MATGRSKLYDSEAPCKKLHFSYLMMISDDLHISIPKSYIILHICIFCIFGIFCIFCIPYCYILLTSILCRRAGSQETGDGKGASSTSPSTSGTCLWPHSNQQRAGCVDRLTSQGVLLEALELGKPRVFGTDHVGERQTRPQLQSDEIFWCFICSLLGRWQLASG